MQRNRPIFGIWFWLATLLFLVTIGTWACSYLRSFSFCTMAASPANLKGLPSPYQGLALYRVWAIEDGQLVLGLPILSAPGNSSLQGFSISNSPVWSWWVFKTGRSDWIPSYSSVTTQSSTLRTCIIPIVMPSAVFGLCAVLSWRRAFIRYRWKGRTFRTVVRDRLGNVTSKIVAAIICVATLFAMPFLFELIDAIFSPGSLDDFMRETLHFPETMRVITVLFVAMLISYTTARVAYPLIRWKISYEDADHCLNCSYDLTGNVSGICPECGSRLGVRPLDAT